APPSLPINPQLRTSSGAPAQLSAGANSRPERMQQNGVITRSICRHAQSVFGVHTDLTLPLSLRLCRSETAYGGFPFKPPALLGGYWLVLLEEYLRTSSRPTSCVRVATTMHAGHAVVDGVTAVPMLVGFVPHYRTAAPFSGTN